MSKPAPRKRRNRDLNENEVFGDFAPRRNPAALYSYRCSLVGLVPLLGLVLGPIAVALGAIGYVRHGRDPTIKGKNFAAAGMILGSLSLIANVAGLACIGHGMEWW